MRFHNWQKLGNFYDAYTEMIKLIMVLLFPRSILLRNGAVLMIFTRLPTGVAAVPISEPEILYFMAITLFPIVWTVLLFPITHRNLIIYTNQSLSTQMSIKLDNERV